MKSKILHFTSILLLTIFTIMSCQKEDEWVGIEGLNTESHIAEQLDSIFSHDNDCLTMIEDKGQLRAIFGSNNFQELDNCHQTPEINFNEHTLIVGKIQVFSISDDIASINLSSKNNKYKVEVLIDKCTECYSAIGYLYFWKVYPKLKPGYSYELVVN